MSMHKSFKSDKFKKKRSVRKRYERFRSLRLQRDWDAGISVFGLPKEKILKSKKTKLDEEEKKKLDAAILTPTDTKKVRKVSRDVGNIK